MQFVNFNANKTDSDCDLGGKAATLMQLYLSGWNVPNGFVIPGGVFINAVKNSAFFPSYYALLNGHVNEIRERDAIRADLKRTLSEFVESNSFCEALEKSLKYLKGNLYAVRSSASCEDSKILSFAGQFTSRLEVDRSDLLDSIKECWNSSLSEQFLEYVSIQKAVNTNLYMAVLVQEMIIPRIAGSCFSVNPVGEFEDSTLIEVVSGLGDKLMSGEVSPTICIWENGIWKIEKAEEDIGFEVSNVKEVISISDLGKIKGTVDELVRSFGLPLEMEWAFQDDELKILQVRPITGLDKSTNTSNNLLFDLSFQSEKWALHVSRAMSLFHCCMTTIGHFKHSEDFGIMVPLRFLFFNRGDSLSHLFVSEQNWESYKNEIKSKIGIRSEIDSLTTKYQNFSDNLIRSSQNLAELGTLESWDCYCADYCKLSAGLSLTIVAGEVGLEELCRMVLNVGIVDSLVPAVVSELTADRKPSPYSESQMELQKLNEKTRSIIDSKEREQHLAEWLKKYRHLPVNFCESPWTLNDARAMLQEIANDVTLKTKVIPQPISSEILKACNVCRDHKEISEMLFSLRQMTWLNEYRKSTFSKASLVLREVLQLNWKQGKLSSIQEGYRLLPQQIGEIIEGKSFKGLNQSKFGGWIHECGTLEILTDQDNDLIERHFEISHQSGGNEIRGFAATNQSISGTVKVVNTTSDFFKVRAGDIVVAPMTSVDFLPLMKLASAYITDEGGITCHAAVVARELNKPCIVRTRVATKILNDGDYVYLDGKRGIIHIKKRN